MDPAGRTPLHYAALDDDVLRINELISSGESPDAPDKQGFTPLHLAAQQCSVAAAATLLDAGASVDAENAFGNTPLFVAVFNSNGRGELIGLLRSRGSDPLHANNGGQTPVGLARLIGNYDVAQFFVDVPNDHVDELPSGSLEVLVSARVEDDEQFVQLARWWLMESRSRLCGSLWTLFDAGVGSVEAAVGRIGVPSLGRGDWSVAFTAERFEVLMASLHERGADAFWHIHADPAEVAVGDCCSGNLAFSTESDSQPWVSFSVSASYRAAVNGVVPAVGQHALLEFVADFAELSRASFANITDDNSSGNTALETFFPRLHSDGLVESPAVLRGYSWVTVVPPKALVRLGGVGAMESSGAFVEVRPLRYGGVVLRATDRFEEYDDEAMARVFRALAPALPSGRPRQLPAYTGLTAPRLVYEDGADYER